MLSFLAVLQSCGDAIEVVSSNDLADLADDEVVCTGLRLYERDVVTIGMDSGVMVETVDLQGRLNLRQISSLAVVGDMAYACDPNLAAIDLLTGRIEQFDLKCNSVTDLDGGLVLFIPYGPDDEVGSRPLMAWYPTFDDLLADTNGEPLDQGEPYASRLGRDGDLLLSAWHSADDVDRWDPETGAYVDTMKLRGYDTWIWGVSGAGGRTFVVNDGRDMRSGRQVRIAEFDHDGRSVRNFFLGERQYLQGLSCRANVDPTVDTVEEEEETTGAVATGGAEMPILGR